MTRTDCCSREGLELMGAQMAWAACAPCARSGKCPTCPTADCCNFRTTFEARKERVNKAQKAVYQACKLNLDFA